MFFSNISGKTGIITGGTSGYGLEMVLALQEMGANIAAFSIDDPSDETLKKVQGKTSASVRFHTADLLQENSSAGIVEQTLRDFGNLDFVIANAGFAIRFEQPLLEVPVKDVTDALTTQFKIFPIAFLSLALEAAKVMEEKYAAIPFSPSGHRDDSGAILVTLSEAVISNLRTDLIAYAAAKKATQWIMESLAVSLGPKNIRVNGIAPGFANTAGPRKFYDRYPEIHHDVERLSPLKPSFMHPGSIVPAITYLLTDNYVTGQTLALDGGYGLHTFSYFDD